jgi:hypothetical protein
MDHIAVTAAFGITVISRIKQLEKQATQTLE